MNGGDGDGGWRPVWKYIQYVIQIAVWEEVGFDLAYGIWDHGLPS